MDPGSPRPFGLKLPGISNLKIPRLSRPAIDRKKALTIAGVAVAVIAVLLVGGFLVTSYLENQQVALFCGHISASEADLFLVHGRISVYMQTPADGLLAAGCDDRMREFAAIARYGRDVTAYHRQIIASDTVPEAYSGAQSAYIRALDRLNHAFSFWSSAATAYDMRDYAAANRNLAEADGAWQEYTAAVAEYDRELRAAEEGAEVPPEQ
ncbi:MAG: hypothetical protein GX837_11250 [Methanomicrobiales archaeon]|jgi:hypothetical protein|nr:hypothetical protein [Methanomicrobiales archaeon]